MKAPAAALAFTIALSLAVVIAIRFVHTALNTSPSMPLGLYRTWDVDRSPRHGDIVIACAPDAAARVGKMRDYLPSGPCAGGTAPILKFVAAVAGDVVDLTSNGVTINGTRLADSAPLARDSQGRAMRRFSKRRFRMRANDYWLYAPQRYSYDSRYFGPVPRAKLRGFATMLVPMG